MSELCENDIIIEEETTANKHSFLIGYYNYTVVLTYIGMLVGFLGIMFATNEQISKALICLLLQVQIQVVKPYL